MKTNSVNLRWPAMLIRPLLYYFWRVFCNSHSTWDAQHLLVTTARRLAYPGGTTPRSFDTVRQAGKIIPLLSCPFQSRPAATVSVVEGIFSPFLCGNLYLVNLCQSSGIWYPSDILHLEEFLCMSWVELSALHVVLFVYISVGNMLSQRTSSQLSVWSSPRNLHTTAFRIVCYFEIYYSLIHMLLRFIHIPFPAEG